MTLQQCDLLNNVIVLVLLYTSTDKLLTENYFTVRLKRHTLHHFGYLQETRSEAKVHSPMKVKVGTQPELQNLL